MAEMNFGLEQVLTYRKELEKMRKLEFSFAQQELEGAVERLQKGESQVERLDAELQRRQREGITAMELELYSVFFRRKSVDLKLQRQEAVTLNDRMSEKREILVEAAKDKKVLETLKSKQLEAHKLDQLYKERIFLEEIALRQKGGGK